MKSKFQLAINRFIYFEKKILKNKSILTLLIIGNFLGAIVGFIYYFDIIKMGELYHPLIWILVPDCPMAAFLLIGFYIQNNNQRFHNYNFFVFIQGIRAATITFLLITNFPSLDIEIVVLGHSLLLIQSILIFPLLLGNFKFTKTTFIVLAITIFNDYTDFFGFFNLFRPTLAQYPTFFPKFELFITVVYGLDIFLTIIGILVAINTAKKRTLQKNINANLLNI